jgi:hypothetical protein
MVSTRYDITRARRGRRIPLLMRSWVASTSTKPLVVIIATHADYPGLAEMVPGLHPEADIEHVSNEADITEAIIGQRYGRVPTLVISSGRALHFGAAARMEVVEVRDTVRLLTSHHGVELIQPESREPAQPPDARDDG